MIAATTGITVSIGPQTCGSTRSKMPANKAFSFPFIAANSSTSVFLHGYSNNQAVSYSAVVTGLSAPGVLTPLARVIVTQGETFRHVDGTVARKVYIQNLAPFNPCAVDLLQIVESF
jgi:hypothetical protein